MTAKKKEGPQCEHRSKRTDGVMMRCRNTGVWCWVIGSFGRTSQVLCNGCIEKVRGLGWTVRYQLEGDSPAPLPLVEEGK